MILEDQMRKLIGFSFLLLFSLLASAQRPRPPRFEVFAGYSYLHRFNHFHGWSGSFTWNFSRYIGATADFSGHYRSDSGVIPFTPPLTFSTSTHLHSFTFGPTVSYRNRTRFTPFGHALFGVSRLSGTASTSTVGSSSFSLNNFGEYFGGGLDVRLTPRLAVRAAQFDVLYIRFPGGFWERHFRYSGGIVFRFPPAK